MPAQSRAPVILLTRPEPQSRRFAQSLNARFPGIAIITSPLIAPVYLAPVLADRNWTAVIFTSETAVQSAKRIAADGVWLPQRVFCVGNQTALVARAAGFEAISAEGDAEDLIALIISQRPNGPLLNLHGRDSRVDIASALGSAGIETLSYVTYAQQEQPLSNEATRLLRGETPVIAPIFSPHTGTILAQECARIGAMAPLSIVAISPAAAVAFPQSRAIIAQSPTASAMLDAVAGMLTATTQP